MMKKNGFISISVVYSFFVVFMLILLIILNSYINNRASFDVYKDYVKDNMASKYTVSAEGSQKLNDEIIKMSTTYGKTNWDTRKWYIDRITIDGKYNYYFRGSTPPNFVCLSTDPKDECQVNTSGLYRIIGVFSPNVHKSPSFTGANDYLVKLVKYYPYTTSNYADAIGLLNTQYIDSTTFFNEKIKKMLAETKWTTFKSDSAEVKFAAMRNNELSSVDTNTSFVGMLTASDIGYTTGEFDQPYTINCKPSVLNVNNLSGQYNGTHTGCASYGWNISEQWLYNSTTDGKGFKIDDLGNIVISESDSVLNIRPVIYLKPDAIILKGTGSQDNPYVLNIYPTEDLSE